MKRATFRENSTKTYLEPEANKLGLKDESVVGWFANKYNMAFGWKLLKLTPEEQAEFGTTALRTYSCQTETTSIIKINPFTGTYAFLDNQAYLEGEVKFEKMEAYNRLIMDDNTIVQISSN